MKNIFKVLVKASGSLFRQSSVASTHATLTTIQPQHANPQHANPQHANPQHANPQHAHPQHAYPQQIEPRNLSLGQSSVEVFRKSGFTLSTASQPTTAQEEQLLARAAALENATAVREFTREEYEAIDRALDEAQRGRRYSPY